MTHKLFYFSYLNYIVKIEYRPNLDAVIARFRTTFIPVMIRIHMITPNQVDDHHSPSRALVMESRYIDPADGRATRSTRQLSPHGSRSRLDADLDMVGGHVAPLRVPG